uniref:Aspartic peptidase DDI1-type domain-containing protein n=1 Tax=Nicotiana tabacum TaxID=4097 RepID=A0A1S4B1N6_TOBAC|nr:PREDICTED: uncharacterized protein LOC107803478 [Nicotiana tabacum]
MAQAYTDRSFSEEPQLDVKISRERDAGRKNEPEEPQHVLHMIIGGVDVPQGPIFKRTKVSIRREKRTRDYMPEDTLTFSEEDIKAVSQPHNGALIISILLNKVQVKRVLMDVGSSINIIQSKVVEQLGLLDQIIPASRILNGFNMESETTKGEIILPVNVIRTIQDIKFHVVEGDMRYNALLGKPWIHCMRVVPSTLHQVMKFPTKDSVKTVFGEQYATKEMFAVHDLTPVVEDEKEDFLTPRAFIAPKELDATKSIVEELEQAILIKYLPE